MPIYGDELTPIRHVQALKSGKYNRDIDLIYGVVRDEGTGFTPLFFPGIFFPFAQITKRSSKILIAHLLNTLYNRFRKQEVANFYIDQLSDNANKTEFRIALGEFLGDFTLVCPTILFGEEIIAHDNGKHRFYAYRLMQKVQSTKPDSNEWMGVTHGSDLAYIFLDERIKPNSSDEALSHVMIGAWSNFAKTGSPGSIGSIKWEQSVADRNQSFTRVMELKETGDKYHMEDNLDFLPYAIALLSKLDSTFGDDYPMVKIKNGMVRGKYIETKFGPILKKVSFFQGIPFGKAERFSKPKPAEPWEGVYDATSPKASCYQFGSDPFKLQIQSETKKLKQSEDCLFLNVWVPEKYESGSVMFWVYGGGFLFGTIFSDYYDARQLAADGDVIVVAVNYRLGPLGFLYGDDSSAPGNVGLHDQVLGLKWVHENIESFGGNTSKITIFGESAGSMSIGSLIISPLTKGLFHRAILQSGAPTELVTYSKQLATWRTKSFATKAGCSCNQTMKSIEILHHGICEKSVSVQALKKREILHHGICEKSVSVQALKKRLTGDFSIICPTILFGEEVIAHDNGEHRFYSYRLMQKSKKIDSMFDKWMGIVHGSDVPYIFLSDLIEPSSPDEELSHDMIKAWSNFAKTGSPGSIGSVEWKQSIANRSDKHSYTRVMELKSSEFHMEDNVFKHDFCNKTTI
ncbi:Cocaine esterase [Blomia tropicalis]|nr:Cocaine esterase [Blomia tropicalis]